MINKILSRKNILAAGVLLLAGLLVFQGCTSGSKKSIESMEAIQTEVPAVESAGDKAVSEKTPVDDKVLEQKVPATNTPVSQNTDVNIGKKPARRLKASIGNESVTGSVYGRPKGSRLKRVAYLTFDDGPSRNNTPRNLNTLKKYGIKATFFVLPHEGVDDIYKRILDEGHEIGNHSYSHDYKILYGMEDLNFKLDICAARDFIRDKLGYTTTLFRFPGGTMGRNKKLIESRIEILKEEGYEYVDWDISDGGTDTSELGKDADILAKNVLNGTGWRNSLVVLMHDSADKTASVKALPIIIEGLKRQGYTFELMTEKDELQD